MPDCIDTRAEKEFFPAEEHSPTTAGDAFDINRAELELNGDLKFRAHLAKIAATVPGLICSYHLRPDGSASMPFATAAIKEIYGLAPEDVRNDIAPLMALVHAEDREPLQRSINESASHFSPWHCIFRVRHPQKGERWIEGNSIPQREPDGSILWHGFVQDVTDRKRAEAELKSSQLQAEIEKRYLEAVFELLPVGVVLTDTKGGVIRSNNMDEKIWGRRPKTHDVDDYVQYKAWWADSDNPIEPHEWASAQAILKGKSVIGQVLKIQRFDGEYGYIINSAVPIRNDEGRVTGSAVVLQDITEIRLAEQGRLESIQNLNEYAYALTHNLKAPFRAIQNYAEFLTQDLADFLEGDPKRYLEGLKEAVAQANNQFNDMEILYEIGNYQINPETIHIEQLLKEIQFLLVDASGRQLVVHKNFPALWSERYLLRQLFVNLIENGFKFNCSDIKRVEVGWQAVQGDRVEIFVRDNGIGIDPHYHQMIFNIFSRLHTQNEYQGTGIGLAIVKKAVQKLGGKLRVESATGEGSTFYINLPRYS